MLGEPCDRVTLGPAQLDVVASIRCDSDYVGLGAGLPARENARMFSF
jgi:hypothetical protein